MGRDCRRFFPDNTFPLVLAGTKLRCFDRHTGIARKEDKRKKRRKSFNNNAFIVNT